MDKDDEHLNLLAIFHLVVGGLQIFFGMFGIFHLLMGLAMISGDGVIFSPTSQAPPPPTWAGWIFIVFGAGWILVNGLLGILTICAGRFLKRRVKRKFCVIMAGIGCSNVPFGTVLGVLTIIILVKPEVMAKFGEPANPTSFPPGGQTSQPAAPQ